MKIKSSSFQNGEKIPKLYSCDGKNVNPPLEFEDVPENTVTLALIMEDPDAPGGTFDHWLIWNIDSKTRVIKEEDPPIDVDYGINSSGFTAYTGPCPPKGEHRYFFKLFALSKRLDLNPNETSKSELMENINTHLIDQAELMGRYSRI